MSDLQKNNNAPTAIEVFNSEKTKQKFEQMLGKRASQFMTSVLQIVSSNSLLKNADGLSIYNAACIAASMDLPLNNNLGFAWIVPYNQKFKDGDGRWQQKQVAQFQIGWKGFVQLALRTGQYERINVLKVYENQFVSFNTLTEELNADFTKNGEGKVVGYVAYFRLINKFEKVVFWSRESVEKHARKYSKSFETGQWSDGEDGFHGMALKTVLKNTIAKWGILSIEMHKAIISDQGVAQDDSGMNPHYIDNEAEPIDKVLERAMLRLAECKTITEVEELQAQYPDLPMTEVNAQVDIIINATNK